MELVAVRAVKKLCGAVWSRTTMVYVVMQDVQSPSPRVHIHWLMGALSRRPGPVPFSADDCELAELLRDCRRDWAFVECLYCGRRRRD